jgi:hypothetical protein
MRGLVREFVNYWNLRLWRLVLKIHQPLDVGPPTYTWCQTCSAPWPCEEFANASNQIDVSTGGGSSDQRR